MSEHVWVYYNKKTGNIEKISPRFTESNTLGSLQVYADAVADIFAGKKSLEDFKVIFET